MADDPTRPALCGHDDDGNELVSSICTPADFATRSKALLMPTVIIPIIFVPGVMGTLLRTNKTPKASVWSPPNSKLSGLGMVMSAAFKNAAARQKAWNPETTEVDDTGPVSVNDQTAMLLTGPGKTPRDIARFRGWNQLHVESYSPILNRLETQLAYMLDEDQNPTDAWKEILDVTEQEKAWGAQKGFAPLTVDELKKAAKAAYPVHAVGYNWLQSNLDSGKHLSDEVDKIIDYYSNTMKRKCDRVIVVTHSMGGLVTRAYSQLHGGSGKILGILHGVQPAIGAPASYKRFRTGFENVEQVILGRNAAECTAVLGNSPAGLQLLPTKEYVTELDDGSTRHWLCAANHIDVNGNKIKDPTITTLGEGNPYKTIYADNSHWWRLIREELLDPAGLTQSADIENPDSSGTPAWNGFLSRLADAEKFHNRLQGQYHSITYAYYAADPKQRSWRQASWTYKSDTVTDPTNGTLGEDAGNGTLHADVGQTEIVCSIDDKEGVGDGTVPAFSAASQAPYCVQIFKHEGAVKGHFSYDHQHSYSNDMVQSMTLHTIIKIAVTSSLLDQE